MGPNRQLLIALLVLAIWFGGNALAQSTGQTVRRRKVAEQNSEFPVELTQAEAAIEKRDYRAAEAQLKNVVAANPNNYQAWFDLGFVYNALGNSQESIAAYRR